MNYFDLFQIELTFDIDVEKLQSHYQKLQRLTHPDKIANASDAQKRMFMQKNAQINDAFHVLMSPVLRAEHMLQLRDFPLVDANASMSDTEFLMQQMELRETMAEASSAAELTELNAVVDREQALIEKNIGDWLSENDEEANQKAAAALTKLKFFTKLKTELEEKLLHI